MRCLSTVRRLEQVCIVDAGRRNPDTHFSWTERRQSPVVLQLQRRTELRAHGGGGQAPRAAVPQCAAASHASDDAHRRGQGSRHQRAKLEPWRTDALAHTALSCRVEGRVHGFLCAALLLATIWQRDEIHLCLQSAVSSYETAQTHLVAWNTGSMHAR